jgi:predicted O-linked N-acetylglucosamine transferase (SPINDLY family)
MPDPTHPTPATSLPPGARADLGWCLTLLDAGDRPGALEACERALSQAPLHPDVLLTAGSLALELGHIPQAAAHYGLLTELTPANPRAWRGLARVHLFLGAPGPALEALETAASLAPDAVDAEADHDLAVALTQVGRLEEATRAIDRAIARVPASARFRARKARVLERARRWGAAEAEARAALALDATDIQAALVLADCLLSQNRGEDALARARETLADQMARDMPDRDTIAIALDQASRATRFLNRHADAVPLARAVLERLPDLTAAARILALSLWWSEDFAAAPSVLDAALAQDPDDLETLWLRVLLAPRPLHASTVEREAARRDFIAAAKALGARVNSPTPPDAAALSRFDPLAHGYPFHLPYHGAMDLEAQRAVGQALSLAQERWAALHPTPRGRRPDTGGRHAVAFVGAFFRNHTVCKLFKSWIADMDRTRFHVTVIHLDEVRDAQTEDVARSADVFHHVPRGGPPALTLLRTLAPDAIVYPELGMSNDTLRLAAVRLAPVQALAWGHPATTGLPSMDLFLSSDLMEPPTGHMAYTERLVRLPGLSIRYSPAFAVDDAAEARRDARARLGLDDATPLLLSLQTHSKYHPDDDVLFARLAARLPEARFALIESRPPVPRGLLRTRLETALRVAGVDPAGRLLMLPPMNLDAYRRLNLAGDVFLDNPAWSGGNTTLEAIHCGLPVVTLPGGPMWSRHSAAILTALGISETIASDHAGYVARVERLVRDPAWRTELVARATAGKDRLFTDPAPGLALSDALDAAILRARRGKRP